MGKLNFHRHLILQIYLPHEIRNLNFMYNEYNSKKGKHTSCNRTLLIHHLLLLVSDASPELPAHHYRWYSTPSQSVQYKCKVTTQHFTIFQANPGQSVTPDSYSLRRAGQNSIQSHQPILKRAQLRGSSHK